MTTGQPEHIRLPSEHSNDCGSHFQVGKSNDLRTREPKVTQNFV